MEARRGKLYLCATPIGNLSDVTLRVLDALKDADLVAAEDTRRTRSLFSRYDIHTPLVSYREQNRESAGRKIIERIEAGEDVALVSDAGMPGISDPGSHLVAACVEKGIDVEALPGPNAALTALVVSGLPTNRFSFEGFPPRKQGGRRKLLAELAGDPRTLIFYESPSRVAATLGDMLAVLGDRRAAVARELTKRFEQVIRGTLSQVLEALGEPRGEYVLVVEGAPPAVPTEGDLDDAAREVLFLNDEGMPLKEAAGKVSATAGLSKTELYNRALTLRSRRA
jgi:16S rRNA (cytidine1402-2'-O)-methyltransferase